MTPIPLPNYPHVYQKLTTRWEKIILIILIYLKIFLSETAHDSFDGLDFFQLFPADLKSNIARKYSTLNFIFLSGLHGRSRLLTGRRFCVFIATYFFDAEHP